MDRPNCFGQLYEDAAAECQTCDVAAECKKAQCGAAEETVETPETSEVAAREPEVQETTQETPVTKEAPEQAADVPETPSEDGLDEKIKDLEQAIGEQKTVEEPKTDEHTESSTPELPATEGLEYREVLAKMMQESPQGKDALVKAAEPLVQNAPSKITNYLRKLKKDGVLRDAPHPADKRAKAYYLNSTPKDSVNAFFGQANAEPKATPEATETAKEAVPTAEEPKEEEDLKIGVVGDEHTINVVPEPKEEEDLKIGVVWDEHTINVVPEPQVIADGEKFYIDNFLTKRTISLPYGDKRGCEVEIEIETQSTLSNSMTILDGLMGLAGEQMLTLEDVAKKVKYKMIELLGEDSRVRSVRAYTEKTQVKLY